MAWPTGADVQQRTDITLTLTGSVYTTSYGLSVTEMISDAIAAAALECLRDPEYGFDEAEVTETFDGRSCLQVSHPPILSVSSLTSNSEEMDEGDYVIYPRDIKILDEDSKILLQSYAPVRPTRQLYSLIYTGGYSDSAVGTHKAIPRSLKAIILEMVVRELLRIDQRYRVYAGVSAAQIGSTDYRFTSDNALLSDLYRRLRDGPWTVIGI